MVSGIDDNYFNNNIVSNYKNYSIILRGYDYDELLGYAGTLMGHISGNRRVSGAEIWGAGYYGQPAMEYSLSYDFEAMGSRGLRPYVYYDYLNTSLLDFPVGNAYRDGAAREVVLRSSDVESLDLWHVLNGPASIDSMHVTFSSIGNIVKSRSGLDIRKTGQSYEVCVVYDFIGNRQLQQKMQKELVEWMNAEVLHVGFKAEPGDWRWSDSHKDSYIWLILLIMAVIYVITAVMFESFRLPFPVLSMIFLSYIGTFLVFGLSDITFDQGGFAAFVMLSGIVVNAGIYLIAAWQEVCRDRTLPLSMDKEVRCYVKAYNRKIKPILLTVISTVLGLLPFLSDGPSEVFWFDFAIGTLAGMLTSVIVFVFFLPVFTIHRKSRG